MEKMTKRFCFEFTMEGENLTSKTFGDVTFLIPAVLLSLKTDPSVAAHLLTAISVFLEPSPVGVMSSMAIDPIINAMNEIAIEKGLHDLYESVEVYQKIIQSLSNTPEAN